MRCEAAKASSQDGALILTDQILERWATRKNEWSRLRAQVDGSAVAAEVIADIEAQTFAKANEPLTLGIAAEESGYSTDHLSRLIREGRLNNLGRKGSPRIARGELPIRPKRIAGGEGVAMRTPTLGPFASGGKEQSWLGNRGTNGTRVRRDYGPALSE